MNFDPSSSNSKNERLSIPEAREIVWGAGNIALGVPVESEEQRSALAHAVGGLFNYLDCAEDASDIIERTTGEPLCVRLSDLTNCITAEIRAIEANEGSLHDGEVNPFAINDPNYVALQGLRLYIDAAGKQ
jgi:hypothetical protein